MPSSATGGAEPRAPRRAARLGIGAVDWARAIGRRGLCLIDRTPPDRYLTPPASAPGACARIPVVVVQGVLEPWNFLSTVHRRLHEAGHPVHPVAGLGWNLADLGAARDLVLGYLEEHRLEGAVLVGHSKGGLIGRAVLAHPEGGLRVRGVVATCAPWQGTSLVPAWAARTPLGMFAPGAAEPTSAAVTERIISLVPPFDQVIPQGSVLPGAHNRILGICGHHAPTQDRATFEVLHRAVHELAER